MIEKPANVRLADRGDEAKLYQLLVDMHRHNGNGWGFPHAPDLVIETIECATRPEPETRSNPLNQRRGVVGVIDGPDGDLIGTIGIFLDPPVWFTKTVCPVELWVYVTPEARNARRLERDLARFGEWVHEQLRPQPESGYAAPFPMLTGFMHVAPERRFSAMTRLWRRLFPAAEPIGMLFWRR